MRWLFQQLIAIRTWLLLINIIVVLVPIIGIEWARTYERELLRSLEQDMLHQAQLLRTLLEKTGIHRAEADSEQFEALRAALRTTARRTRMRIRLLDREQHLIADSHKHGPPEGPEPTVPQLWGTSHPQPRRHPGQTATGPLSGRREIRAARRGEIATATRVHRRIQRVYLFVAIPVMVQRRVEGIVYVTRSTVPVLQSLYRLRSSLFNVLGVALGFTVLLSLFLAATISRPLGRLTRNAERIASGDRTVSLRLKRGDEIGKLARSFDALVKQLDARARYISEFAANISHEFKSPLTSIRGAAELLADGAHEDPEARQRFLCNILGDVERLDRLVSRLLELSRIEATLGSEPREDFDLSALVADVAEQFTADESTLIVVDAGPSVACHGTRAHVRAALCALVENAVQHSPPDRPVTVTLTFKDRVARVSVTDHGPGISEANQGKIFDRFFTTRAHQGGSGLGLSIVATVASAHGGVVAVESKAGQGSTFTLQLPASKKRATGAADRV